MQPKAHFVDDSKTLPLILLVLDSFKKDSGIEFTRTKKELSKKKSGTTCKTALIIDS